MTQDTSLQTRLKRAGSADSQKIKEALEKTADLELVTGTFTLDEKHNPIKSATILEFKEGKQVFNTKINP